QQSPEHHAVAAQQGHGDVLQRIGRNGGWTCADALQFHEEHGEVCPANWKKGDKGMNASPEGVAAYLTEHAAAL
ncbi:hypothetical protein ACQKP2_13325, partial [Pseudomonas sp. NPDC089569]